MKKFSCILYPKNNDIFKSNIGRSFPTKIVFIPQEYVIKQRTERQCSQNIQQIKYIQFSLDTRYYSRDILTAFGQFIAE